MRTAVADIRSLVERVDRGEIRLPEIQRGYAWKPPKVAALMDSLYRRYPTGSLLFWETDAVIVERDAAIEGPKEKPLAKPQYLLDGQQRLTSLHRVFEGHAGARIVFHIGTERFQNESAATKKDPRWLVVHELLTEAEGKDTYTLVEQLRDKVPELTPQALSARIDRVKKIADYPYHIEILESLPYEEVTEIFVRVNSRGERLGAVDLALATLSARWPGVIAKLSSEAEKWKADGYPIASVRLLARCLAALGTKEGAFRGFAGATTEDLEAGWTSTRRGMAHLVALLRNNAGLATSALIPSENALVPLVAYLGMRPDQPLEPEQADGLLYWLLAAFVLGRYNRSVDTNLAQDLAAVRSADPIDGLLKNLGLFGSPLTITEDALVGRGANSPYFLLSFLVAKQRGAKDWWYGVDIGTDGHGAFKLEYHHVHPRARLRAVYSKPEINDLANLAFISGKANRKISDRRPADYFPELGDEQLSAHLVPLDPALREPEAYPEFVRQRRKLLASAMNELLESYRPPELASTTAHEDPVAGERLVLTAYGDSPTDEAGRLLVVAERDGERWEGVVALSDIVAFFEDLRDGNPAGLAINGDYAMAQPSDDVVKVPFGPLLAIGTLADWGKVLEREFADLQAGSAPAVTSSPAADTPVPFPILDSE